MNLNRKPNAKELNPLPTRRQLVAFLQRQGVSPDRLKQMSAREQVQLTKEYQQSAA